MAKKTFELLSETMFYVLMALQKGEMCGAEVANWVEQRSEGRIKMGPGTLYTILVKFADEDVIQAASVSGRRKNYRITEKGVSLYYEELKRLHRCVADAERED